MSDEMEMHVENLAKSDLTNEERLQFDVQFASRRKDPKTALVISIFGGYLGIDRFYIGEIGLGIGKLLTFGGLGVWTFIDWFLIMRKTRARNATLMYQVRDNIYQSRLYK